MDGPQPDRAAAEAVDRAGGYGRSGLGRDAPPPGSEPTQPRSHRRAEAGARGPLGASVRIRRPQVRGPRDFRPYGPLLPAVQGCVNIRMPREADTYFARVCVVKNSPRRQDDVLHSQRPTESTGHLQLLTGTNGRSAARELVEAATRYVRETGSPLAPFEIALAAVDDLTLREELMRYGGEPDS
jgi:hypothetical protein